MNQKSNMGNVDPKTSDPGADKHAALLMLRAAVQIALTTAEPDEVFATIDNAALASHAR
jgi:hypothetical protein